MPGHRLPIVEVEFATGRLEGCFRSRREATREWGPVVARSYTDRIGRIIRTRTFRELFNFGSFRMHPLHGEYAGKYAISLTGRYRLIVGRGNGEGRIVIYEVTNHYDD